MTKTLSVELSHGRPRAAHRRPSDGGSPAMPSVESAPMHDPVTGRFLPGNRAHRRRLVRQHRAGIATMNPETCDAWLRPFVEDGGAHAVELARRFADPALARLIGATADAHAIWRALSALGAKGDTDAMHEARGWLREYRACMRELAVLAGLDGAAPPPDDGSDFTVSGEAAE